MFLLKNLEHLVSSNLFNFFQNFPLSDHEIEEFFKSSQPMEKQVENLVNNSNVQGAIQFLRTASSVLNEKWNGTEKASERIKVWFYSWSWSYSS